MSKTLPPEHRAEIVCKNFTRSCNLRIVETDEVAIKIGKRWLPPAKTHLPRAGVVLVKQIYENWTIDIGPAAMNEDN